ncbi:MAG: phage tail protein [Firmicutes bacterium]|nr:phage tail protein [Bacillota bacterium]
MANTVNNVNVGKPLATGAVFYGATSLTLPTDATTSLASGFKAVGYVSEDGVTNTNSPETDLVHAWGGDVVMALQTSRDDVFTFTLIESANADVLKAVYGDDAVTTGTGTISVSASQASLEARAWVIDMVLRNGGVKRIVIPNAVITEVGDITYKDDEIIGYPLTLTCMPDSSNKTHYEYISTT